MKCVILLLSIVPGILPTIASSTLGQTQWPSFRNGGSGTTRAEGVPTTWSPDRNIAWRADIPGYGQSSPVIWGTRVFVTSTNGPWQEHGYVHAFDLLSGSRLWTREVAATTRVENYFRNSRAAPTSVVDAERIVSFFPGGDVVAIDHSGKTLWSTPLFEYFGEVNNDRGTASSLAQTDDLVFVLINHDGPSYITALSKTDGSVVWQTDRGRREPSWTSPVVTKHNDRDLVIVSSAPTVDAYDAATGDSLWRVDGLKDNLIPSATVTGDAVFVGSTEMHHQKYSPESIAASNCRIDLVGGADAPGFRMRWGAARGNAYDSSPLAIAGYVYYVNKIGLLFCCDADTGEEYYRRRIGAPCWASPVGVTNQAGESVAYFPMKNGSTLALRPGPAFEQLAKNDLWDDAQLEAAAVAARQQRLKNRATDKPALNPNDPEAALANLPEERLHQIFSYGDPIVYAVAITDGRLLIRTGQQLVCIAE